MASLGTVKEVKSGDCFVITGVPRGGPPPEKTITLSSIICPRMAMKSLSKETQDDPLAFEAREFMRKKLIGKQVEFKVDYSFNSREYGTVKLNGESVSYDLLRQGLGKLKENKKPPCAPDIEELTVAQAEAEEAKRGLWNEGVAAKAIRDVKWASQDPQFVKDFANKHKGHKLKAIVEYVRDGGCIRVLFVPQNVYSSVLFSGIQVDGFKRQAQGLGDGEQAVLKEPFAAETKYFVESRLLNRDIEVRVEGADEFGNLYGSVYHPNGQMSILLLKNGFAKIVDGSARLTESVTILREAQKEAQAKKLRKWKDWTPTEVTGTKEYAARVLEVLSGDCAMVQEMNTGTIRRLYTASIRSPKLGGGKKDDEPWAFDAKEFCRKKLVGKKVKVLLEYTKAPMVSASGANPPPPSDASGKMMFVSYLVDNEKVNLSEQLIANGLAKTLPHRPDDDRAANYDVLVDLEKQAAEQKKGIHGAEKDAPKHRFNDLLGPSNATKARGFEGSLTRLPKIEAVVEYVFNAGRYKLRLPSENLYISFALAGIKCPQTARKEGSLGRGPKESEPFAEDSMMFAKENILQHDVTIKVEACDKGGNFLGTMWRNKTTNVAAELLEIGFAQTVEYSVNQCLSKDLLLAAEKKAKDAKLRVWSLPSTADEGAAEDEAANATMVCDETLTGMVVSHINGVDDIYIQDSGAASPLPAIQAALQEIEKLGPAKAQGRKGDVVAAKFEDGQWYRAKVEAKDNLMDELTVLYIDYGNSDRVASTKVASLPSGVNTAKYPPQAKHCALAGILPPHEFEEEASRYLGQLTDGKKFHVKAEKREGGKRHVILTEEEAYAASGNAASVNELLVGNGLARLDKKSKTKIFSRLLKEEEQARKAHINMWRYGDVGDDDDERDFPSMLKAKGAAPAGKAQAGTKAAGAPAGKKK